MFTREWSARKATAVCMALAVQGAAQVARAQQSGPPVSASSLETIISSDTQFVSWHSSNGNKGHQLYNPFTIAATARQDVIQANVSIRSGYVDSYQLNNNTFFVPGFGTFGSYDIGNINSATDTQAQIQLQYLGLSGIVPYFSIGVNVPTGHRTLKYNFADQIDGNNISHGDPFAVGQSDVVFLTHFGEGLNVMVGGGASVRAGPGLILSLGGTYNFRNEYISAYAVDIGGKLRYSPGDQLSLNVGVTYDIPTWSLAVNAAYRTEQTSDSFGTFIGPASFRLGDTISVDASVRHAWSDQHATTLFAAFTHVADNDHVEGAPPFAFAFESRNSNVYEVALSHDYRI